MARSGWRGSWGLVALYPPSHSYSIQKPPSHTHPHTDSTGSAARSPADSRSGSLRARSGSRAGTDGFHHTRPHLQQCNTDGGETTSPCLVGSTGCTGTTVASILEGAHVGGQVFCLIISLQLGIE